MNGYRFQLGNRQQLQPLITYLQITGLKSRKRFEFDVWMNIVKSHRSHPETVPGLVAELKEIERRYKAHIIKHHKTS